MWFPAQLESATTSHCMDQLSGYYMGAHIEPLHPKINCVDQFSKYGLIHSKPQESEWQESHLVVMTMISTICSHTMRQKSPNVFGKGPVGHKNLSGFGSIRVY